MRTRPIRLALQALALAGVASLLALLVWKLDARSGWRRCRSALSGKRPPAPNFNLPRLDGDGNGRARRDQEAARGGFLRLLVLRVPYESKRLEKYSGQYGNEIAFVGVNTERFSSDAKQYVAQVTASRTRSSASKGRKVFEHLGRATDPADLLH